MKMLFLFPVIALMVGSLGCSSRGKDVFIPGVGVDCYRVGEFVDIDEVDGLRFFKDTDGNVECIYPEDKKYKLVTGDDVYSVGDNVVNLKGRNLRYESGTSDIVEGDWYVSNDGFVVVVLRGRVMGIGVCEARNSVR